MILEKIQKFAGKLAFFVVSLLLVVLGAMYLRQKDLEQKLEAQSVQNEPLIGSQNKIQESVQLVPAGVQEPAVSAPAVISQPAANAVAESNTKSVTSPTSAPKKKTKTS